LWYAITTAVAKSIELYGRGSTWPTNTCCEGSTLLRTAVDAARQLRDLLAQFGIQSEETLFTSKPELEAPLDNTQVQRWQAQERS